MSLTNSLSLREARRLAITAQGLNRAAGCVSGLENNLKRLGVMQIDAVNALVRAHYLPLFSRLGPYSTEELDQLTWGPGRQRAFFEYWGHEASFLPLNLHPFMRWRMDRAAQGEGIYKGLARFGHDERVFVRKILRDVAERGPVGAGALGRAGGGGPWWGWSREKTALEWLFAAGEVTVAGRSKGFERLYDLPERVIPPPILNLATPPPAEAQRHLIKLAAAALGVATEKDLRDYYRLPAVDAKARVAELVESGDLRVMEVERWKRLALAPPTIRPPRRMVAGCLISPFDSLIWDRNRTERLFEFYYRLEFYTPAPRRIYGYHVLPFLHGDRLVGRIDLKADRAGGRLTAPALFAEDGFLDDGALMALASNLTALARWLNLERVDVSPRGALEKRLRRVLKEAGIFEIRGKGRDTSSHSKPPES